MCQRGRFLPSPCGDYRQPARWHIFTVYFTCVTGNTFIVVHLEACWINQRFLKYNFSGESEIW